MRVDATELACPSAVCRRVPPDHHQHPFDPCPTRARVVFHSDHFGRGRGVQARARCSKTRCRSSADGRQVEGVVWQTPSPRQASCGATGLFVRGACECAGVGKTPGTVSRGNYRKRMKVPRCVGTPLPPHFPVAPTNFVGTILRQSNSSIVHVQTPAPATWGLAAVAAVGRGCAPLRGPALRCLRQSLSPRRHLPPRWRRLSDQKS